MKRKQKLVEKGALCIKCCFPIAIVNASQVIPLRIYIIDVQMFQDFFSTVFFSIYLNNIKDVKEIAKGITPWCLFDFMKFELSLLPSYFSCFMSLSLSLFLYHSLPMAVVGMLVFGMCLPLSILIDHLFILPYI